MTTGTEPTLTTDEMARQNGEKPAGNGACGISGDSTIIARGLTKRELFAAMAMQGHCANSIPGSHHSFENTACEAVQYADALLKELAK